MKGPPRIALLADDEHPDLWWPALLEQAGMSVQTLWHGPEALSLEAAAKAAREVFEYHVGGGALSAPPEGSSS